MARSLRSGMIPLVDSTKTTGIVFFPGTMVGMLVAGAEPVDAVRLQLVLLWVLLGAVALAALIATSLGYRGFFTEAHQLRESAAPGAPLGASNSPDEFDALWAFLVAALIAFAATPPVARLARRLGVIHLPRDRDLHDRPVPGLGGLGDPCRGGRVGAHLPALERGDARDRRRRAGRSRSWARWTTGATAASTRR